MRKVFYKRWLPIELENGGRTTVKGTGCFEANFSGFGLFHQWASNYVEEEAGIGTYTVALVELSDGTIEQVLPSHIKFIDQ